MYLPREAKYPLEVDCNLLKKEWLPADTSHYGETMTSLGTGLQLSSWKVLLPPETTLPTVPDANFSQAYQ